MPKPMVDRHRYRFLAFSLTHGYLVQGPDTPLCLIETKGDVGTLGAKLADALNLARQIARDKRKSKPGLRKMARTLEADHGKV